MRTMKSIILTILCGLVCAALLLDSAGVRSAAAEAIQLCLNTIVPSLFAFIALSTFAVSCGLVRSRFGIFVLSVLGGYPIGAKLLSQGTKGQRSLIKSERERMLAYCFCPSPALLLVLIPRYAVYVWLSNVIACALFAVLDCFCTGKSACRGSCALSSNSRNSRTVGELLVSAVTETGQALVRICLMIVAFAVMTRLLEFAGVMGLLPTAAYGVLDITMLTKTAPLPLPLVAALTSTGGLCVLAQISAVVGRRLSLRRFFLMRIPIALVSLAVCCGLTAGLTAQALAEDKMPLIPPPASGSWVASVCLLMMSLILIKEVVGEEKWVGKTAKSAAAAVSAASKESIATCAPSSIADTVPLSKTCKEPQRTDRSSSPELRIPTILKVLQQDRTSPTQR